MTQQILHDQAKQFVQNLPEIRAGYTVRVHERIQDEEGGKGRIQVFEGLVIGVHKGHTATDRTITVRRIASGVGVEKNFPLASPVVEKIEVKKVAKVRRAKLNFLRGRLGKSARLSERFTTAEEFAIAAAPQEEVAATEKTTEVPVEEAKKEEKKADKKKE
jgi:large subunit ribosomal protein L19